MPGVIPHNTKLSLPITSSISLPKVLNKILVSKVPSAARSAIESTIWKKGWDEAVILLVLE